MEDIKKRFVPQKLENGMVRTNLRPHTKDIELLPSACSGPVTASYYFLCKCFDISIDGEKTLSELAKLQDAEEGSNTYGCCRWYREESRILDTNGAFFVLLPVVEALLFGGEKISNEEKRIIAPVLERASVWFEGECKNHGYFYPNKIMSDGALLLALAKLENNEVKLQKARSFWNGWVEYTEKYGWGWGENTSKVYTRVMITALNVALSCLDDSDELYTKLFGLRKSIVDYRAYHGEQYEFVPSVRTYNFEGLALTGSAHGASIMNLYQCLADELTNSLAPTYVPTTYEEVFRKEHIFADSHASTYKGKNIRLGTIDKFPVMPGCYQNESWGLGWQSMPVSVLAVNHETSFLRFVTVSEGKMRTHPATDKHSAYLDNALFGGENIPEVMTLSNQKDNTAVVVRTISHVANNCSYLADEWYMQHFDGKIFEHNGWIVFDYGDCALALKALSHTAKITCEDVSVRVAQTLYDGADKLLVKRRLTTAWAVAVFDRGTNVCASLDELCVSSEEINDLYYPRPVAKPLSLKCGEAQLVFDSDFSCGWEKNK